MDELIVRNGTGLFIKSPVSEIGDTPDNVATAIARAIPARRKMREALGEVTADNWREAEALMREFRYEDDALMSYEKEMKEAAFAFLGLASVKTQTSGAKSMIAPSSLRGVLREMAQELERKIAPFKEADRPKVPVRAVPILLYATDKGAADLADKIAKGRVAGVEGYRFAPDEVAEKAAAKILEGGAQ